MFVSEWMTRKVFTIRPEESVSEAIRIMKEQRVKHLPVVQREGLKGIVSDRDIKEFSPSKATTLDIYELHYLFARAPIREVMKGKVITTTPDAPVEEAAKKMYDNRIGCLPVLEAGRLAGIICEMDIFRALVDITGVRHGGHRIYAKIADRPGSIKEIADIIRKHGFSLQSILTSYEGVREGFRKIVIRTKGTGKFGDLKTELLGTYRDVRIRKG